MQTLANWPPLVPGACKWWAKLEGTTLVIARDKPLPEEASTLRRQSSSHAALAQELADALIVREIDLTGSRCCILTQFLNRSVIF